MQHSTAPSSGSGLPLQLETDASADRPLGEGAGRTEHGAVERILAATEECFHRTGYAGASIREIAERAGVSKSLVLYHFVTKERLFAEFQLRIYQRLARGVLAAAEAHRGTPAERALFALDSLMAAIRQRNDLAVHAVLSARALSDEKLAPDMRHMRRALRALLYRTVEQLFGADITSLPLDVEATADLLWAVLTGLAFEAALDDSAEQLERGFSSLRSIIALALRPAAPAVPPPARCPSTASSAPRQRRKVRRSES